MKKLIDTKGLKFKLWSYIALFAAIIMIILWLLQIIFLRTFYEGMKKNEIEQTGKAILSQVQSEDFADYISQITYQRGVIAGIYDENGFPVQKYYTNPGFVRPLHANQREIKNFIGRMNQTPGSSETFTVNDERMHMNIVVFGAKIPQPDGTTYYLYLNSPLAPVDATTQVLQKQLIIITVISLLLAFILSYFIARRMSKPITKITDSAKKLATGDYSVVFEKGGYTEINQLADVMNHTTRELNKTDQLRRDLMANVSHDLRTPLTIIKSYAEMIRDISGNNPEKRDAHAGVIIDETDRLALLVSDILDLSKIESGASTPRATKFDLTETIRKVLEKFHVLEENEGYVFHTHLKEHLTVYADEARIQQVLYNLISNAVNYTGEDKTVTITATVHGQAARVEILDTGKGIPPEEQDKGWERYYKSSQRHTRTTHGTGIGLSIVKGILNSHHADFGVDSSPGNGSAFWFELKLV